MRQWLSVQGCSILGFPRSMMSLQRCSLFYLFTDTYLVFNLRSSFRIQETAPKDPKNNVDQHLRTMIFTTSRANKNVGQNSSISFAKPIPILFQDSQNSCQSLLCNQVVASAFCTSVQINWILFSRFWFD